MSTSPLVSIILPVFNGAATIEDCVHSLCVQSYEKLEIIILDDGSNDGTDLIIKSLSSKDERIIYIKKENEGLVKTLNRGIELSNGELIARMDADDICEINRIKEQVHFLNKNPAVGLIGSSIREFGNRSRIVRFENDSEIIQLKLLFQNELAHPSIMVRKELLLKYNLRYESRYLHVEDFALWSQLARYTKLSNINQVLLRYRVASNSVSSKANSNLTERDEMHKRIYKDNFDYYNIPYTETDLKLHRALVAYSPFFFDSKRNLNEITKWLGRIKSSLQKNMEIDDVALRDVLSYQNFVALNKCSCLGLYTFYYYLFHSPFGTYGSFLVNSKFFFKCFLRFKSRNAKNFNSIL